MPLSSPSSSKAWLSGGQTVLLRSVDGDGVSITYNRLADPVFILSPPGPLADRNMAVCLLGVGAGVEWWLEVTTRCLLFVYFQVVVATKLELH